MNRKAILEEITPIQDILLAVFLYLSDCLQGGTSNTITREDIKQIPKKGTKSRRNRSTVEGKGMHIQILFVYEQAPRP